MPALVTEKMLKGYGLTTAELYYRLPDYRSVLNSFIWQDYDLAPDYPALFRFIEFWRTSIEGPLHSIRFTHRKLIAPGEWRNVVGSSGCIERLTREGVKPPFRAGRPVSSAYGSRMADVWRTS